MAALRRDLDLVGGTPAAELQCCARTILRRIDSVTGHLLEGFDGFISIERFESVTERGKFVALSFWRDERSVDAFRNISTRRGVQARSRAEIFDNLPTPGRKGRSRLHQD